MGNYSKTYHHIADILSFETSNDSLELTLNNPKFNWDSIVVEASKYLVLTTVFCRLKSRNLLHTLPEELLTYLEELASVNRNRNASILKQVYRISRILNEHSIEHVFLKGTALMAAEKYDDLAERMIGDIDILVEKTQIQDAFNILKSKGYNKTFGYAYENKGFRHLDRLISGHELAAIELHSDLLIKKHRSLINLSEVFQSKVIVNGIAIPSSYHLSLHQIWGWQLNDLGHYYNFPSLKVLYDSILLKSYTNEDLIKDISKLKFGNSFLQLAKTYFLEYNTIQSNFYMNYINLTHNLSMLCKPIRVFLNLTKVSYYNIHKRIDLLINNKSYTNHIINKLFSMK